MLKQKKHTRKNYDIPHKVIEIPNELLMSVTGMVFNPAIVEAYGKILLFYRYESSKENASTDIGCVELNECFSPLPATNINCRIPRFSSKVSTIDDPRAFLIGQHLYLICAQGVVVPRSAFDWKWCSSVGIFQIGISRQNVNQWLPKYGDNLNLSSGGDSYESEKNWSPFAYGERIFMVYQINPLIVIEYKTHLEADFEVNRSKFDQSFWKHGQYLGGGTQLVKRGNEYIGFFHSFTDDHPNKPNCRTYHVGYYVLNDSPPFRVKRMSTRPILTAQPDDSKDLRGPSSPWRPNCIYPCGFIIRGSTVYLSQGWQDCRCQIIQMELSDIEATTREVKQLKYEPIWV